MLDKLLYVHKRKASLHVNEAIKHLESACEEVVIFEALGRLSSDAQARPSGAEIEMHDIRGKLVQLLRVDLAHIAAVDDPTWPVSL